jgi:hypothetical protein
VADTSEVLEMEKREVGVVGLAVVAISNEIKARS